MTDRSTASPNRQSSLGWWINLVVSVAILAGCVFGYTLLGERQRPQRTKRAKSDTMPVVDQSLLKHEGPIQISASGVVVPLREIRLATEVAGRIVYQSENLRAGRMVDQGEVLIRLDATEYELEVSRLKAQIDQEAAEVASIEVSVENTQQMIELAKKQAKISQGERRRGDSLLSNKAISISEVEVLKRSELTSQSALVEQSNRRRELVAQKEALVQNRALTEVLLQRAQLDLSRCELKSPIRGRVVMSTVEEQSFVTVGTTFVTIEDTSSVEILASLTVDQMVWIWNSQQWSMEKGKLDGGGVPPVAATVSYQAGSILHQWAAQLERVDGAGIDLQTRTYPCLFRVDANQLRATAIGPNLTRGMFVSVLIDAIPNRTLYDVPEIALRPGNRLWLKINDRLHIVPVNIVSRVEAVTETVVVDVETSENFADADSIATVIVSPISDPTEGLAVSSGPKKKKNTPASDGKRAVSAKETTPPTETTR